MRSPVYWHPLLYRAIMKTLYGTHFGSRYRAIAELIPAHASVTEVCAGDGYLYEHYLKQKNVTYLGLDINSTFVQYALKRTIPFQKHNLLTEPIPVSQYVVMQGSLYQFIPEHYAVVKKLLQSATAALLIAEPVQNLSDSSNPLIAFIAKYSANPGGQHPTKRFNKESLLHFFRQFSEFKEAKEIEGGRELIGIFEK